MPPLWRTTSRIGLVLPARVPDDRLLTNDAIRVVVVVFASVPEVHVQHEQLDRAEPTRRPARRLLDELGTNVGDATVELLEHLGTPLDGREILTARDERVEQEPDDGELGQLLGRRALVPVAVVHFEWCDLDADVVANLLDAALAHLLRARLAVLLEQF